MQQQVMVRCVLSSYYWSVARVARPFSQPLTLVLAQGWHLALCNVFYSLHYSLPPTRGGGTDPGPVLNI